MKRTGARTGNRFRELEIAVVFRLAEVFGAKQLRRADDVRPRFRRTCRVDERLLEIRGRVGGAAELQQGEFDGRGRFRALHADD